MGQLMRSDQGTMHHMEHFTAQFSNYTGYIILNDM
jgi:hypothetical protein